MSKIVPLFQANEANRVTPEMIAIQRINSGKCRPVSALLATDQLERAQLRLQMLMEIGEALNALPDEVQMRLEVLGVDGSAVFDYAFSAHFELSVAEQTMRLLTAAFPADPIH
ncbi:MAG TPA: hypothetical protein DCO74_02380 [Pseudomonas sp.]|jgi:hypothetical protein|nr:hypothetical protein [Pseudomonas sp.]